MSRGKGRQKSCKSIEHFLPVVKKSCSAQGHDQPSYSDTSSIIFVHDSVQSSLAQNSTTCCTTSDIPASPTPSPVSSVSLTKRFISTSGSQIHSSTEPCLSSSVRSTTFEPQVHQPSIVSQPGDSFHPDIGIIYVDCKLKSRNFCTSI